MNRREKEVVVGTVLETFSRSKGIFVVNFKNINVSLTTALRKKLVPVDGKLIVVKNSLLHLAAQKNSALSQLGSFFKDQIALVYAFGDLFQTVSLVNGFLKSVEVVEGFKAGFVEKIILKKDFDKLAAFKSEKEVYAKLCGILKGSIANLVFTLKQVAEKLKQ